MWQIINSLKIEKKYLTYILQMSYSINKIERMEMGNMSKDKNQPKEQTRA